MLFSGRLQLPTQETELNVSFGITTTRHFDYLQKFWGKRFISSEFEVRNKYGYIADLGVVLDYRFSDKLTGDIACNQRGGLF